MEGALGKCSRRPDETGNQQVVASSQNRLVRVLQRFSLFGGDSKQKLLYVPDADKQPDVFHEIPDSAIQSLLFDQETGVEQLDQAEAGTTQMLGALKDIDKESTINQVEILRSKIGSETGVRGAHHVFMVFETTRNTVNDEKTVSWWWSLERDTEYVILQRSRDEGAVKDNKKGVRRNKIRSIKKGLKGKGTIQYLFALLWGTNVILTKYHIIKSNCQTLIAFISKQVTEKGYEYQCFCNKYSSLTKYDQVAKIIRVLIKLAATTKHPLLNAIDSEEADRLDEMIASGKYDVDGIYSGVTLVHYAIVCSKTTMVQHLLEKHRVDPAKCSPDGIGSLHLAAYFATTTDNTLKVVLETGEFDVNRVDRNGDKAILYALAGFNSQENVRYLIEKGAEPDIANRKRVPPIDVAVTEKTKILVNIVQQTSQFDKNHVAPTPTAARNAADDTSGDDQCDPALAQTLSKQGPSKV